MRSGYNRPIFEREARVTIDGPLARAARALVQWPRDHVARRARLDETALMDFERGDGPLPPDGLDRLRATLQAGGAVFIPENGGGCGVRLKFARKDVRAINRMEGEGGPVGEDDV